MKRRINIMAFCKSCGGQIPDGANNCPNCGAPVGDSAAFGAQQQQYQQQQQQTYNTNSNADATEAFLGKDYTAQYDPADISTNKVVSGFAYIAILFWLPLVAAQGSPYGKFHANQGLMLLLFGFAVSVASGILGSLWAIPFAGSLFIVLSRIVASAGGLCELGLLIYGMVNTFGYGKAVELPLIGRIKLIK